MSNVTKPIALDESINTTESTPRNIADVLADELSNIADKIQGGGSGARKADLTNLDLTGTTNTTGSTIASGTYFYLNGTLVRAKTAIASGATFTLNTNYEVVTVGDRVTSVESAIDGKQKAFKSRTMSVTTSSQGDVGLGLYTSKIQIVTAYANGTWANVGLYIVNGEWGVRVDKGNTTLKITIIYYDV